MRFVQLPPRLVAFMVCSILLCCGQFAPSGLRTGEQNTPMPLAGPANNMFTNKNMPSTNGSYTKGCVVPNSCRSYKHITRMFRSATNCHRAAKRLKCVSMATKKCDWRQAKRINTVYITRCQHACKGIIQMCRSFSPKNDTSIRNGINNGPLGTDGSMAKNESLREQERERLEQVKRKAEKEKSERIKQQQMEEHKRKLRERMRQEQMEKDRLEQERRKWEREEKERLEREKKEKERLEREKRERLEREKREKERLEKEKIEKERLARAKKEKESLEREKRERLEREKRERERLKREKWEREKLEREKKEREKLEVEKRERERLQKEKWERERVRKEKLERERLQKEKVEREKSEREKRKRQKLEREKKKREQLESDPRGKVQREKERKEKERRIKDVIERKLKEKKRHEQNSHSKRLLGRIRKGNERIIGKASGNQSGNSALQGEQGAKHGVQSQITGKRTVNLGVIKEGEKLVQTNQVKTVWKSADEFNTSMENVTGTPQENPTHTLDEVINGGRPDAKGSGSSLGVSGMRGHIYISEWDIDDRNSGIRVDVAAVIVYSLATTVTLCFTLL